MNTLSKPANDDDSALMLGCFVITPAQVVTV